MMDVQPVTLEGLVARLEPPRPEHAGALFAAAVDQAIVDGLIAVRRFRCTPDGIIAVS